MINLILVEDQQIVLQGLTAILKYEENIQVVAKASNCEEAINKLGSSSIDVAIVDIELPDANGLELTKIIKETYPAIKVLILSMYRNPQYIKAAIDFGADGYMLKDNTDQEEMVLAIKEVANGGVHFGSEVTKIDIVARRESFATKTQEIKLTKREEEVMFLLADGLTTPQIAEELFITTNTVDTHRKHLLKKFDVKSTVLLIKKARELGFFNW